MIIYKISFEIIKYLFLIINYFEIFLNLHFF